MAHGVTLGILLPADGGPPCTVRVLGSKRARQGNLSKGEALPNWGCVSRDELITVMPDNCVIGAELGVG
jgi:hypothetical protein